MSKTGKKKKYIYILYPIEAIQVTVYLDEYKMSMSYLFCSSFLEEFCKKSGAERTEVAGWVLFHVQPTTYIPNHALVNILSTDISEVARKCISATGSVIQICIVNYYYVKGKTNISKLGPL